MSDSSDLKFSNSRFIKPEHKNYTVMGIGSILVCTNPAIGISVWVSMYCTRLKHLGLLKRLIRYTVVVCFLQSMIRKKNGFCYSL